MAEIEIISTEIIKPSFPTPPHRKTFKLSLLDQLSPTNHVSVLLLYHGSVDGSVKLASVKSSLSKSLTLLFPFAGRIVGNTSIDCDDQGVPFVESRVHCDLAGVLNEPRVSFLKQLLPVTAADCPLYVQANFFDCGGLAMAICASHKMIDAAALNTLIGFWAVTARGHRYAVPEFIDTSMFLLTESIVQMPMPLPTPVEEQNVTRRLVFDPASIKRLRDVTVGNGDAPTPTRVESVSAIIWKCVTKNTGMASILRQAVNIRKRLDRPLPETAMGNFIWFIEAEKEEEEHDGINLNNLIGKIKSGANKFSSGYLKRLQGKEKATAVLNALEETAQLFTRSDVDVYVVTSRCRFKLYDADFGWGKLSWVAPADIPFANLIVLLDTPDGDGIEAWVTLKENHMAMFERDQELLSFATLNPRIGFS